MTVSRVPTGDRSAQAGIDGARASYRQIIRRCEQQTTKRYADWGGRGISMCPEWRASFDAFLRDMGPRPLGHSIDRINNDGNYEPGNCRWASPKDQANNRRKGVVIWITGEPALTPRQTEVFAYIRERLAAGQSPTWRELGQRFQIASTNGVTDLLSRLRERGAIDWGRRVDGKPGVDPRSRKVTALQQRVAERLVGENPATYVAIAEELGVSPTRVQDIAKGLRRKGVLPKEKR